MKNFILKHFTTISSMRKILESGFRLSDGSRWEDQNDKFALDLYRKHFPYARVLCFCQTDATIYHWQYYGKLNTEKHTCDRIAEEKIGCFIGLDAEKFGPALSHAGGDDDPRLTRVGKFLRAHHLDELPQLWNVFCGDMAFIGYRPERKFFIDQIMEHDPRYSFLYQIRPGVTSYATLYNGYTDTMEKMLRRLNYDLYYLEHRSFWFDIKTLWLTFVSIIFGKKF